MAGDDGENAYWIGQPGQGRGSKVGNCLSLLPLMLYVLCSALLAQSCILRKQTNSNNNNNNNFPSLPLVLPSRPSFTSMPCSPSWPASMKRVRRKVRKVRGVCARRLALSSKHPTAGRDVMTCKESHPPLGWRKNCTLVSQERVYKICVGFSLFPFTTSSTLILYFVLTHFLYCNSAGE